MLGPIEYEARMHIPEAPASLVEPFKAVVDVASGRLENEGEMDPLSRNRMVLIDKTTSRLYQLSDVGGALGDDGGLFVNGLQLDADGIAQSELIGIQIPRAVSEVNQGSLYLQRAHTPEDASRLAVELAHAVKVDESEYEEKLSELRRKQEGLEEHPLTGDVLPESAGDAIDLFEAQHSLPEDRSHWNPQG